ncbi:XRE family transcriptional regulator [Actinomadura bangladeshensis]|uniref:XRE family transcriptional regulator n=1 Tax=Actinomadura bangladeshensis TaxID=453573 RepID=UPI001EF2A3DE|nr:XRE family transcriptional regulator [Actinomadura bangladeshensis]
MTDQPRPPWAARIEAERRARGWGTFKAARRLYAAAGIDHPDLSQVKNLSRQINRHEKGEVFPSDWGSAYATAFGMEEKDLFGQESTDQPMGTVNPTPIPDDGNEDVKRRAALQFLAALGAGTAVPPGTLEEILSGIDRVTGRAVDLDEWEQTVYEYGQKVVTRPTGSLVGDLTADIIAVGRLLDRARTRQEQTGLLRVSAGLSGLLAIVLGDAGEERSARITWGTARRAADKSGDRDLQVWTRGRAAQDAFWAGRSHQFVVGLIDEAITLANGTPSAGLARAYAARAYMAADQRDDRLALASLNKVKEMAGQLPDGTQTVLAFRESQLRWTESYVLTRTGSSQATTVLGQAIDCYPPGSVVPVKNLALMRAEALVRARDIDAGLQEAVSALQEHPEHLAAGTSTLAAHVLAALPTQARALPAARELRALTPA